MEVCCYNLESALTAQQAGADRVELCADRYQGGTTPSYGMMEVVRKALNIPVFVMIRPRGGDFLYSGQEVQVMMHDVQMAKELKMDGVVLGVLQGNGQVDVKVMKKLINLARPLEVTFHRAFDLTPDPIKSLQDLISLGVNRVLTSGQHNSAFDGRHVIRKLTDRTDGQISIMPGAGINEENIAELLKYTGVREFHVSASGSRPSRMKYRKQGVLMGTAESEYSVEMADGGRIKKFRELAHQLKIKD